MPRVSEFTREELGRRYNGTYIRLHLEGEWTPVYLNSVFRDSGYTNADFYPAKSYNQEVNRQYLRINDLNTDLSLPKLGYINEEKWQGGYLTRNITRSYKRGFDASVCLYRDGGGLYKSVNPSTVHYLFQPYYPTVEEATKELNLKAHGMCIALNKEFALISNVLFKLPVIGYDGNDIGLYDAEGKTLILRKQFDWLNEIESNPFKGQEIVYK